MATPEEQEQQSKDQGFVYPPPPSFYQEMQLPAERLPLGIANQDYVEMPPPTGADASKASPTYPNPPRPFPPGTYPPPERQFPYGAGGSLPSVSPQPKRPRKWIWMVVAVISVAALLSCGLCSWAFYSLFNTTFQGLSGATNVANDYYQHVQSQDYAGAYKDLQINNLTAQAFVDQAQQADTQSGSVTSYVTQTPAPISNGDPNSALNVSTYSVTVNITRARGSSYPVLLSVKNIGGSWKITYFDKL